VLGRSGSIERGERKRLLGASEPWHTLVMMLRRVLSEFWELRPWELELEVDIGVGNTVDNTVDNMLDNRVDNRAGIRLLGQETRPNRRRGKIPMSFQTFLAMLGLIV